MTPILIISHGSLAESIKESAALIIKIRENVHCLGLKEGEALEEFKNRLEELLNCVASYEEEAIIVSDFPLATPFNAAAMLMESYKIFQSTGMSMQMLLVLLHRDNSKMEPEALCRQAIERAKDQTVFLNDFLKGGDRN